VRVEVIVGFDTALIGGFENRVLPKMLVVDGEETILVVWRRVLMIMRPLRPRTFLINAFIMPACRRPPN
jgi:hypothetical protein